MGKYDLFISYSHEDVKITDKIEQELKKYNISYFIDRTDIWLGEDFAGKIAECIYNCKMVLFVWTENSNQSKDTANEISLADKFGKTVIPFKIGNFNPNFNLAYNLVRFNRIDADELNRDKICSMAAKLAKQLGKYKISESSGQDEKPQSVYYYFDDTKKTNSVLKIQTDTDCRVIVNSEEKGIAYTNKIMRIPLCAGSYSLFFESIYDKKNFIEDSDFNISEHTEQLYNVKLNDTVNCHNPVISTPEESTVEVNSDIIIPKTDVMTPEELYKKGCIYYWGKGVAKNYKKAVYWFLKAAEKGNVEAMCNLGNCYYDAHGVEQDFSKVLYWFQKAAEKGDTSSMNNLALLYNTGNIVKQDYKKAAYWFQKAAEKGDYNGMNGLGKCYYLGSGVEQNYDKAVYWFLKAVEKGNCMAMNNLAHCYNLGNGVEQDYSKAVYWYHKAAEKGDAEAMFNLGDHYWRGNGVSQDYTQAAYWYQKAAEEGVENAMCNLGICYHKGLGVKQNFKKAVYWYQKAAEKGNYMAINNLGVSYQYGQGVEKDETIADKLYEARDIVRAGDVDIAINIVKEALK